MRSVLISNIVRVNKSLTFGHSMMNILLKAIIAVLTINTCVAFAAPASADLITNCGFEDLQLAAVPRVRLSTE
jgi:hypothetical protein